MHFLISLLILRMGLLLKAQEKIDHNQLGSSSFFGVWKWDSEIYFSIMYIARECELGAKFKIVSDVRLLCLCSIVTLKL